MAFKDIFKDENEFNEKTIIGFMSFAVMTMYSVTDLVTGYFGMELPIKISSPTFTGNSTSLISGLTNHSVSLVFITFLPFTTRPISCFVSWTWCITIVSCSKVLSCFWIRLSDFHSLTFC